MRQVVVSVLLVGSLASYAIASQARGAGAGSTARIGACALLPRELVEKVMTGNKTILSFVKPEEEPLGPNGSSCDYAGIGLQIDPLTPARFEEVRKKLAKELESVSGVGDAAYFRNNRNEFAELLVRTGSHVVTIQIHIPAGGTAAAVKPNTITLANAIIPKLR